MIEQLFSESWYRVAPSKPRLQQHVSAHRQQFRDEHWFVLQDAVTGQYCRIDTTARWLVVRMDGQTTLDELWDEACETLGDDLPTQDEIIRLVGQLHRLNLLAFDKTPDMAMMAERYASERKGKLWQYVRSPLALRLPLFDPSRFLNSTASVGRALFNPVGFVLWAILLGAGVLSAAMNWSELALEIGRNAFSLQNWLIIACVYPFMKLLHELGHGYAAQRWNAPVHELGLMFLVFIPVPYVDASASTALPDKHQRMAVAFAGIAVEAALAAAAVVLWSQAEPGMLRTVLLNVALIGGVSTLLFNGNPLLRFDGYYVFSDWLELPNLGGRANGYVGFWLRRHVLRLDDEASPAGSRREACWLGGYSVAAFAYRIFISLTIALFVATEYFVVGVLLAMWFLGNAFLLPLFRTMRQAFADSDRRHYQPRLRAALTGVVVLAALAAATPMPYFTVAHGVLWMPDEVQVRAGEDCFVEEVFVAQDAVVAKGTPLARCSAPELAAQLAIIDARTSELKARYRESIVSDPVERGAVEDELQHLASEAEHYERRIDNLTLRSQVAGKVVWQNAKDMPGLFVNRGDYLGYVDASEGGVVRLVVHQDDVALVREDTRVVEIRSTSRLGEIYTASELSAVPAGSRAIPHAALAERGGGPMQELPDDRGRSLARQPWFQFEAPVAHAFGAAFGERAYVRIRHSDTPYGVRLWRAVRRVFLEQFAV